jgi:DNA-binding NarL/FixJ family response regulator
MNPSRMPWFLVVNDSAAVRDAIRSFLEVHTPYRLCGEANDSIVAVEKARESNCDLILLNLSMPKPTDGEAALALRSVLPRVKIVGFSTAGEELGAQTLAEAGFDVVLSKRDGLEKLTATVMALLPAPPEN